MPPTLHLRSELGKYLEHRSALTPSTTASLTKAGYTVNVERSPQRIFDDSDYASAGAHLVPENTWYSAPKDHIIIGLKELPVEEFALEHIHIQFAHCYKQQAGWKKVLGRFERGGGTLLDLEFLTEEGKVGGKRVAAFGFHAGFAGAALAVLVWAWQLEHSTDESYPSVEAYDNQQALTEEVKKAVVRGKAKTGGREPRVLVIGALGRCGRGAVQLCKDAGLSDEGVIKWDIAETKAKDGPYPEIVESDIFVNCIYLMAKIPNFVDMQSLESPNRKLSVVCDVSADTTNPNNPIPIYDIATTFDKPTVPVIVKGEPPLSVISIDHLPSLLPREASEDFSKALLPHLMQLKEWRQDPVWAGAEKLFHEKVVTLPKSEV